MKKLLLSVVTLGLLNAVSFADTLGAEVGYAKWSPSLSGTIQDGTDSLDFEDDLGYGSSESNSFLWLYVDHPIPLFPNVKLQKTNYSDSARGKISKTITFDGAKFVANAVADSKLTLNQTDIIAYWRILDNWINFDLGLNIKAIDGNIKIDTTTKHADEDFKVIVPALYTKVRFDLPFSGFSVEGDMSYIGNGTNEVSDSKFGVVYENEHGLGGTLGIRTQRFKLDDDDTLVDINIKGTYAGIFYHF